MADYLSANDDQLWKDTAYVSTGGKHGARKIAEVLRKIGVPVKAVCDIDFLNEKGLVKETVEAFGGSWDDCEPLFRRVDAAVRKGLKPKNHQEIKTELRAIIDEWPAGKPPRSRIEEAMKQNSSWNLVKQFGRTAIPKGTAQSQYEELKQYLEGIGIYLVPVGEIENFCRHLGSHGPKFVNKLLTDVPFDDSRLAELREFTSIVHKGAHAPLEDDAENVIGPNKDTKEQKASVASD